MKLPRRHKLRRGVLTLEWILIITVVVIGAIGGLSLVRNAVVLEMSSISNSIMSLQVDPNTQQPLMSNLNNNDPDDSNRPAPEQLLTEQELQNL